MTARRLYSATIALTAAVLLSACDFWPKDLDPLAGSITRSGAGETTALLLGGDVVVIIVESSPLFESSQSDLEIAATAIADQAIEFSPVLPESIVVTFYKDQILDDANSAREFIFLLEDNRPVLQPSMDFDAAGPLMREEFETQYIDRLGDALTPSQRECVLRASEKRAVTAGDPETVDPASVAFLSPETWNDLDAFGRRLILGQAIVTEALFDCAQTPDA